jgi:hypothetical protein
MARRAMRPVGKFYRAMGWGAQSAFDLDQMQLVHCGRKQASTKLRANRLLNEPRLALTGVQTLDNACRVSDRLSWMAISVI